MDPSLYYVIPHHSFVFETNLTYILVVQACPHLIGRPKQVQEVLQQSARKMFVPLNSLRCGRDTSTSIPNNYFGHGVLNIDAAIKACRKVST